MTRFFNSFLVLTVFLFSITTCFAFQSKTDSIGIFISEIYTQKNQGKVDEALKNVQTLLTYAEENNDTQSAAYSYYILAQLYYELERYDQAVEYSDMANVYFLKNKNHYYTAINKAFKSMFYIKTGLYDEAETLLQQSRSILKAHNLLKYEGNIDVIEGYLELQKNNVQKAILKFKKSLPIQNKMQADYMNAIAHHMLADGYLQINNITAARNHFNKSEALADEFNFKELQMLNLKLNSLILEKEGFYEASLKSIKRFYQEYHQFYSTETLISQNTLADKQELDFKTKLLASNNLKMQENNEKLNKSNLTSIFTSALLIIISLLTISLYRNNKIKLKTNELLVKKNNELILAKDNAVKAMNAKTQFLSTVSHELRTPLYAVTGLTYLLLQENPTENQKEHLKSLKFSGEYLLNFINDILQVNKIEANKLSVQNIPFHLEETVTDVVSSLNNTAKENNNTLNVAIDNNIPKQLIGDPIKLSQIFINLLGNALKFTENGNVTLSAQKLTDDKDNILIHFEVKDNGIGISEETQRNIFSSFAQGSIQINRKYGGTGLGLTIVKSLLKLLKSDIHLESTLGEGATFSFDISFEKIVAAEAPVSEADVINPDPVIKGLHVLLVEDNKINQVITKKMLHQKEMTCDIADDGYIAIDKAKSNNYDIILMDIHMPGISGLKATEEIRKFNTEIPIIALTAISLDENTDDFYQVGCNDIVAKPFKPDEFYKAIAHNILATQQ